MLESRLNPKQSQNYGLMSDNILSLVNPCKMTIHWLITSITSIIVVNVGIHRIFCSFTFIYNPSRGCFFIHAKLQYWIIIFFVFSVYSMYSCDYPSLFYHPICILSPWVTHFRDWRSNLRIIWIEFQTSSRIGTYYIIMRKISNLTDILPKLSVICRIITP